MAVVRTVSTNYLLFTVRCSVSALFIMYILSTVTVLIFSTGMINSKNLINDGLTSDCKNNNQAVWTYNQGVLLGGLTYLSKATGNATLIQIGQNIADATISTLVYPSGVLEELCEKNNGCGADSVTFKGVFVRYLGIFASNLSPSDPKKTVYVNWLKKMCSQFSQVTKRVTTFVGTSGSDRLPDLIMRVFKLPQLTVLTLLLQYLNFSRFVKTNKSSARIE